MSKDFEGHSWNGRKIASPEDVHDLEARAAVGEFKHRMPREDAEHRAHFEYKQDKHREAAAYHLSGMKAAQANGSSDEGRKHGMMYQLHMKALGHDPMGAVPNEIKSLVEKQERFYKFRPHRADSFLLQGDTEKSELAKALPKTSEQNTANRQGFLREDPVAEDRLTEGFGANDPKTKGVFKEIHGASNQAKPLDREGSLLRERHHLFDGSSMPQEVKHQNYLYHAPRNNERWSGLEPQDQSLSRAPTEQLGSNQDRTYYDQRMEQRYWGQIKTSLAKIRMNAAGRKMLPLPPKKVK